MDATQKKKVLNDWVRFLKSEFQFKYLTDALYRHLTLHCDFVSYFSKKWFYTCYFEFPEQTLRFIRQFDRERGCPSVEYGNNNWLKDPNYSDINNMMVDAMEKNKTKLLKKLKNKIRQRDIKFCKALLGKHGIEVTQ